MSQCARVPDPLKSKPPAPIGRKGNPTKAPQLRQEPATPGKFPIEVCSLILAIAVAVSSYRKASVQLSVNGIRNTSNKNGR